MKDVCRMGGVPWMKDYVRDRQTLLNYRTGTGYTVCPSYSNILGKCTVYVVLYCTMAHSG